MRLILALLVVLLGVQETISQGPKLNPRYDLDYNANTFPQAMPKESLASVLKAIQEKRIDYLLAHLTDPAYVDDRVQVVHKGKFEDLVREVTTKVVNDPDGTKLLQRFAREGEWDADDARASVRLKDVKDRVYFVKLRDRWFLENAKQKTEK